MQTCADIWQKPINVVSSEECCALGAAMFAATISGAHPSLKEAQTAMSSGIEKTYLPQKKNKKVYDHMYAQYNILGSFVEEATEA